MKWTDKVKALLRTAVTDLFSEETGPHEPDRAAAQLDVTQARLNVLQDEVALAVARAKRAQQAWQTAQEVKLKIAKGAWRFAEEPQTLRLEKELAPWRDRLT